MMQFQVTYDSTAARGALDALSNKLKDRSALTASVEAAAAHAVRQHLTDQYATRPNKLGAPSTGYWKRAIEGTTSDSDQDGATVSIRQTGVRLKWEGGTITAGQSGRASEVTGRVPKFLTIPVTAAAHGESVASLGSDNFYIVPFAAGGGLKEGGTGTGGGIFRKTGGKRTPQDRLYWILKRSVRIRADKNILPREDAIREVINEALAAYFA